MKDTNPLKVLQFCPRCGSEEFIAHGDRSLKCKKCSFHLFINSAAAVAALIFDEQSRLMLVTRGIEPNYGKLDLPGGFIDPGETAEHAVARELKEELNLSIESMSYIGSEPNEYIYSEFSVYTLDMAFVVKAKSLNGLQAMDDILDYQFYHENELNYDDIPAPSIKAFVKQYYRQLRGEGDLQSKS